MSEMQPKLKKGVLLIICIFTITGQVARMVLNRLPFHLWVQVFDYELLIGFIDASGICAIILCLLTIYATIKEGA